MATIAALDIGTKRVGVALGQEETKTATPFDTFDRAQGRAETKLLALVTQEKVAKIIAGLPLNEDGSLNDQCLLVLSFCRRLKRRLTIPILFVDEYLTSVESQEILSLRGKGDRAQRESGTVDAVSAMLIAQRYLETGATVEVPVE